VQGRTDPYGQLLIKDDLTGVVHRVYPRLVLRYIDSEPTVVSIERGKCVCVITFDNGKTLSIEANRDGELNYMEG
jgi:hypothetical protein